MSYQLIPFGKVGSCGYKYYSCATEGGTCIFSIGKNTNNQNEIIITDPNIKTPFSIPLSFPVKRAVIDKSSPYPLLWLLLTNGDVLKTNYRKENKDTKIEVAFNIGIDDGMLFASNNNLYVIGINGMFYKGFKNEIHMLFKLPRSVEYDNISNFFVTEKELFIIFSDNSIQRFSFNGSIVQKVQLDLPALSIQTLVSITQNNSFYYVAICFNCINLENVLFSIAISLSAVHILGKKSLDTKVVDLQFDLPILRIYSLSTTHLCEEIISTHAQPIMPIKNLIPFPVIYASKDCAIIPSESEAAFIVPTLIEICPEAKFLLDTVKVISEEINLEKLIPDIFAAISQGKPPELILRQKTLAIDLDDVDNDTMFEWTREIDILCDTLLLDTDIIVSPHFSGSNSSQFWLNALKSWARECLSASLSVMALMQAGVNSSNTLFLKMFSIIGAKISNAVLQYAALTVICEKGIGDSPLIKITFSQEDYVKQIKGQARWVLKADVFKPKLENLSKDDAYIFYRLRPTLFPEDE